MLGVSAFPPGFGSDEYMMFACGGSAARTDVVSADVPATEAAPSAAADPITTAAQADVVREPVHAAEPVHYTPQVWAQAEPTRQQVRLGRRGFYLARSQRDDLASGAAVADNRMTSVMIPTAVVGTLLAMAGYFFDVLL